MRVLERLAGRKALRDGAPFWSLDSPVWTSRIGQKEQIGNDFEAYVNQVYKANGVVFACSLARMMVFSEARFQWQRINQGRPTEMFGDSALSILETPWPNGTTGELLARMEQDATLAGQFYGTPIGSGARRRLRRMRPDWVTIVTGVHRDEMTREEREDSHWLPDPFDLRAQPVGYIYLPRGGVSSAKAITLTPDQMIHYSPLPDPIAQWRGMSWLTPIIDEIKADKAATKHKLKFFEHGTVPGMVVTYDASVSVARIKEFREALKKLEGVDGAYKTLHLGGGADAKALGADFKQLEFKVTQGHGESRVAAAARVPAVIAGISEGLAGSSLNAGNFSAARRLFADGTVRSLWRSAAAACESVLQKPAGPVRLWYDDRDVPFLREDAKEAAKIRKEDASTLNVLISAGFEPDSAVRFIQTGDYGALKHTALVSVQLQEPGSDPADHEHELEDDE